MNIDNIFAYSYGLDTVEWYVVLLLFILSIVFKIAAIHKIDQFTVSDDRMVITRLPKDILAAKFFAVMAFACSVFVIFVALEYAGTWSVPRTTGATGIHRPRVGLVVIIFMLWPYALGLIELLVCYRSVTVLALVFKQPPLTYAFYAFAIFCLIVGNHNLNAPRISFERATSESRAKHVYGEEENAIVFSNNTSGEVWGAVIGWADTTETRPDVFELRLIFNNTKELETKLTQLEELTLQFDHSEVILDMNFSLDASKKYLLINARINRGALRQLSIPSETISIGIGDQIWEFTTSLRNDLFLLGRDFELHGASCEEVFLGENDELIWSYNRLCDEMFDISLDFPHLKRALYLVDYKATISNDAEETDSLFLTFATKKIASQMALDRLEGFVASFYLMNLGVDEKLSDWRAGKIIVPSVGSIDRLESNLVFETVNLTNGMAMMLEEGIEVFEDPNSHDPSDQYMLTLQITSDVLELLRKRPRNNQLSFKTSDSEESNFSSALNQFIERLALKKAPNL